MKIKHLLTSLLLLTGFALGQSQFSGGASGNGGGGNCTVAGSQFDIQTNSGGGGCTAIASHSALTGQIPTGVNAGATTYQSQGVAGRSVAGASDTIQCDSATALVDRLTTIQYTSASAVAVTLPDAGSSGCGANFAFAVLVTGAGGITITRQTASTITWIDGLNTVTGATSVAIPQGAHCSFSSPDNANWIARCVGLGNNVTAWYSPVAGSNTAMAGVTQNATRIWPFFVTNRLITTGICYQVQTADNTANLYDIGIYNNSGVLLVHIGATAGTTAFAATGQKCLSWTVTTVNLPPGEYSLAITSSAAAPAAVLGGITSTAVPNFYATLNATGGTTASGVLNASGLTIPATSWAGNAMVNFSLH